MSATYKIAGSFVLADPITHEWQPILAHIVDARGFGNQSRFREATLRFPAMTTAQYAEWAAICDDNTLHVLFMPRRVDGVYATGPELFTGTYPGSFSTHYRLHFLGSRHSTGVYIYDTEILAYMACTFTLSGGGG